MKNSKTKKPGNSASGFKNKAGKLAEQVIDAGAPDVGAQEIAGAVEIGGNLVTVVNEVDKVCSPAFRRNLSTGNAAA